MPYTTLVRTFSNGNSITYIDDGVNTLLYPAITIQKKRVPVGKQIMAETSFDVLYGANDSITGALLPQKTRVTITASHPITASIASLDLAVGMARSIIASTEWSEAVTEQKPLL